MTIKIKNLKQFIIFYVFYLVVTETGNPPIFVANEFPADTLSKGAVKL